MHWTAEITLNAAGAAAAGGFAERLAARAETLPGLSALDLYTPAPAEGGDPLNPPEPAPDLVAILSFDTEASLRAACAAPALAGLAPPGRATSAGFERRFFPVADGPGTPLAAPVSYLVRYELPADDAAAFRALYLASHPPVQARLPGIRSILCEIPLAGLALPGIPEAGWLIGNEVVFDSAADFAAAMRSPARAELRAHMADFPPWSGVNHHHLMQRQRVHP
jgi:hypothetical protein